MSRLIDAEQLEHQVKKSWADYRIAHGEYITAKWDLLLDWELSDIAEAETVENRKSAHWKKGDYFFRCSACGKCAVVDSNYCPDCGAYMTEEDYA